MPLVEQPLTIFHLEQKTNLKTIAMKSIILTALLFVATFTTQAQDYYRLNDNLELRKEPTKKAEVIVKLNFNDTVKLVSKQEGWVQVQTMKGAEGYIIAGYMSKFDYDPANPNKANGMPIGGKILLLSLIIIVIGIILGFTKWIVVYENYNDLALTFGIVALLIVCLPFSMQLGSPKSNQTFAWIAIIIGSVLLLWTLLRAVKQNNVLTGVIAFIVKLPLVITFLYYGFKMLSAERVRDKVDGGLRAGLIALLMNGLVKEKEWKSQK